MSLEMTYQHPAPLKQAHLTFVRALCGLDLDKIKSRKDRIGWRCNDVWSDEQLKPRGGG